MFKPISITAIALGAMLIALSGAGTSMPVRSADEPAMAVRISPRRALELAGECHARVLLRASRSLDSALKRAGCESRSSERFALAGKPASLTDVNAD